MNTLKKKAAQPVQAVQPTFAAQPVQTVQQPEKGKNKKLIIGLSSAGAACVLAVVFLIVNVFSNGDTSRSASAGAGNDSYSDNRGGSGNNTIPSSATPTPATPTPATPIPATPTPTPATPTPTPATPTPTPATPTPATYTTSELIVVGTTAANIKNGGIYTANGGKEFWVDHNRHSIGSSEGNIYTNQEGTFSNLSYYDEVLYFLYNGKAYMRNMTNGSAQTLIPELEAYGGNIESLYVTTGCYFTYADGKLYRISRKTGEEEEWIAISYSRDLTLYNGWLYITDINSEGRSYIERHAADDFSKTDRGMYAKNGVLSEPVVDGNYVYVLWHDFDNEMVRIVRFNSDLSDDSKYVEWDISALTDETGIALDLNVVGDDMFVCNGMAALLYVTINGSGYSSEVLNSGLETSPCITRYEHNYELDYQALDEETGMVICCYKVYDY